MIFRLLVHKIEQFPVALLKDSDDEALNVLNCEYVIAVLYDDLQKV